MSPEREKEQVFESPMSSHGIRLLPLVLQSGSPFRGWWGFFFGPLKTNVIRNFESAWRKGSSRLPFSTVRAQYNGFFLLLTDIFRLGFVGG